MYELGLLIALLLWVAQTINLIAQLNSRMAKNFRKIGYRISWSTMTPKAMSAADLERGPIGSLRKFLLVTALNLPFVLLSWLYAAYVVGTFVYTRMKDAGASEKVREFRRRVREMDLSREEMAQELMEVSGQPLADLNCFAANVPRGGRFRENHLQQPAWSATQ